ncbi:alpha/beta fold hydrolase [Falsiroseomonas sp. E2-1-a4]|uniref:alpha/beta fold hydrolase n=1 Tax=Falsiroseomonas sp. E2-1-a4 TaxID=3239299 RepID=UPI003F3A0166
MVDGIAMHALVSAEPDAGRMPVVLVHGLGMSSRYMAPLAACLARDVPVFAPDLPGFGRSSDPPRALTVPGMAAALAGWMDAMRIGRATLVGNSLGCEVLVELGLQRPDLVERLVLQGPTPDPEHASPLRQISLFLLTSLFERPSIARVALVDYLRAGVWRYARTFRHMTRYRMAAGLPQIAVPALVVVGARDYLVPRAWAERMTRLLPQARLVTVPRAAHGMNYSHPREMRDAILPFLRAPPGATRPYRSRSAPGAAARGP